MTFYDFLLKNYPQTYKVKPFLSLKLGDILKKCKKVNIYIKKILTI